MSQSFEGIEKKNISHADRTELKDANKAYTTCISEQFLSRFLSGEKVDIGDFCKTEYARMVDLDRKIYGEVPF